MTLREDWLNNLLLIVNPVFEALSKGELKEKLPLTFHEGRKDFAPLEAFARSSMGISPWLNIKDGLSKEEKELQEKYRHMFIACLDNATNKESKDYMLFNEGGQPLVDAAFLAHSLVRMKDFIAEALPEKVRMQTIEALMASRNITAYNCNWIFFTAMVEAGLFILGAPYDMTRVLYALRTFGGWYKGDGTYGDGPMFHWDYYNSFVIQPMYVDLVELFKDELPEIRDMREQVIKRASRYSSVLERMIGPDGTYPIIGRSICYRFGVFQMLSQSALEHTLEPHLSYGAVRAGLTAVIRKVMSSENMFDKEGFLNPGVYGYQPELAEEYINIGSLYLCSSVFLPLGLTKDDVFWTDKEESWTQKKVWSGMHSQIDHAVD